MDLLSRKADPGYTGVRQEIRKHRDFDRRAAVKLNVSAFAVTCGIVWGLGLFMLTWWIILMDGASADATFIGKVYRGYSVTPVGSFIGLAWAFADGLICGAVFAWLYNLIAGRCAPSEA